MTLKLPSDLACQISDKASAMHMSVDAVAAVLLRYGLEVQEENERNISRLVEESRNQELTEEQRRSAFDALGESIFGR